MGMRRYSRKFFGPSLLSCDLKFKILCRSELSLQIYLQNDNVFLQSLIFNAVSIFSPLCASKGMILIFKFERKTSKATKSIMVTQHRKDGNPKSSRSSPTKGVHPGGSAGSPTIPTIVTNHPLESQLSSLGWLPTMHKTVT